SCEFQRPSEKGDARAAKRWKARLNDRRVGAWDLDLLWSLELGAWCLELPWSLVFLWSLGFGPSLPHVPRRSETREPIFKRNSLSAEPRFTAISKKPLEPKTATGIFGGTAS